VFFIIFYFFISVLFDDADGVCVLLLLHSPLDPNDDNDTLIHAALFCFLLFFLFHCSNEILQKNDVCTHIVHLMLLAFA